MLSRNKPLRAAALALAFLMLAAMLAACGSGSAPQSQPSSSAKPSSPAASAPASSAAPEKPAEPFKIDILTRYHTAESPTADNTVVAEIEKIANVKLNITWVAQTAYDEKIVATIAAGDIPMVMLITGNAKPMAVEVDAVRGGLFWKVGDYLKDYEWLKDLNEGVVANASIDGDLWGMYRTRPLARTGFYYRTDWMKKLNLEAPKSPAHLLEILDKFVNGDPDGNGQADTGGMAQEDQLGGAIAALAPYWGLPNNWGVTDGKLWPIQLDEKYFEIISWMKTAYDRGLMNKDFPTVNSAQRDELMSGKYGFAFTSVDKGDKSIVALKNVNPEADLTVGLTFSEAPEQYIFGRAGWDGKYYVSNQKVKSEDDFRKIMEYFNIMHSPQIGNLIAYGFEGKHYTKVGENEITISEEQKTLFLKEVEVMEQLGFRHTMRNYKVKDLPYYQSQYTEVFQTKDSLTRPDPTAPFNSETYNSVGKELDTQINDNNTKFITGAIDEAGWRAGLEQWRKMGGDKLIADYQAEYDKTKK